MAVVFITNAMLTQWSDQGKVRLDDTTLTLLQENRTVKLKPAVRFTKLIDEGTPDPNKLIGKVKTKEQLVEMAAEHYMDSVILGDVGYQVVEGFLGDLSPPKKAEAPAKKPAPAPVTVDKPPTINPETLQLGTPDKASGTDLEKEAEELSKLFLTTVRDS
jgi:hypothetical protein